MNAPLPESIRKALETVSLDDKYSLEHGRAFMSGTQALVRLPMLQKKRDAMNGLNTAGFISGKRTSACVPLMKARPCSSEYLSSRLTVSSALRIDSGSGAFIVQLSPGR